MPALATLSLSTWYWPFLHAPVVYIGLAALIHSIVQGKSRAALTATPAA